MGPNQNRINDQGSVIREFIRFTLPQALVSMGVSALFVMTCAWMGPTSGLVHGAGFTMLNMVLTVAVGGAYFRSGRWEKRSALESAG